MDIIHQFIEFTGTKGISFKFSILVAFLIFSVIIILTLSYLNIEKLNNEEIQNTLTKGATPTDTSQQKPSTIIPDEPPSQVGETIEKCEECSLVEKEGITIIEYRGDNEIPVVLEFYENYEDDYDLISIYTDFDLSGAQNYHGYYPLQNAKRFKGYNVLGNVNRLYSPILTSLYNQTANAVLHETAHTWCCYSKFIDWNGKESTAWLQGGIHWHDKYLDSGTNDPIGGRYEWSYIENGKFKGRERKSIGVQSYFSNLTLYYMGLISKTELTSVKLMTPDFEPTYNEDGDLIASGTLFEINAENIIELSEDNTGAFINRIASGSTLKMKFVIWTKDIKGISTEQISKIKKMMELTEKEWPIATRGLSKIEAY